MSEHEHIFKRTALTFSDGTHMEGGRRCSCGVEVVGDGPFALNANLVRAARDLNRAMVDGMKQIAKTLEADRRRRYPR